MDDKGSSTRYSPISGTLIAQLRFQNRCAIRGLNEKEKLIRKRYVLSGKCPPKEFSSRLNRILLSHNQSTSTGVRVSAKSQIHIQIPNNSSRLFGQGKPIRKSPLAGENPPHPIPKIGSGKVLPKWSKYLEQPIHSSKIINKGKTKGGKRQSKEVRYEATAKASDDGNAIVPGQPCPLFSTSSTSPTKETACKPYVQLNGAGLHHDSALLVAELEVHKHIMIREEALVGARDLYIRLHGELVRLAVEEKHCVRETPLVVFDVAKKLFSKFPHRYEHINGMQYEVSKLLSQIRGSTLDAIRNIRKWAIEAKSRLNLNSADSVCFLFNGQPYVARLKNDLNFFDGNFDSGMLHDLVKQHLKVKYNRSLKPRKYKKVPAKIKEDFNNATKSIASWLGCHATQNPLLVPNAELVNACWAKRQLLDGEVANRRKSVLSILKQLAENAKRVVFAAIYGDESIKHVRSIFAVPSMPGLVRLQPVNLDFFSESCRSSCSLCLESSSKKSKKNVLASVASHESKTMGMMLSPPYFRSVLRYMEVNLEEMGVAPDFEATDHDQDVSNLCYHCFLRNGRFKQPRKLEFKLVNWFMLSSAEQEVLRGYIHLTPKCALVPDATEEDMTELDHGQQILQHLSDVEKMRTKRISSAQSHIPKHVSASSTEFSVRLKPKVLCSGYLTLNDMHRHQKPGFELHPKNQKLVSPTFKGTTHRYRFKLPKVDDRREDSRVVTTREDENAKATLELAEDDTSETKTSCSSDRSDETVGESYDATAATQVQKLIRGHIARRNIEVSRTFVQFQAYGGELLRPESPKRLAAERCAILHYIREHKLEERKAMDELLLGKYKMTTATDMRKKKYRKKARTRSNHVRKHLSKE